MSLARSRLPVFAALVGVQVGYGLHYPAAKRLLLEIDPAAWAVLRATGAAVVLVAACFLLGRRVRLPVADVVRLAGLSLFGVAINQTLFVEGLSRTTPTHSALINASIPALTLGIAVLLRRERLTGRKLLALGVASVGVALILVPRVEWVDPSAPDVRTGDLLTLLNATSYSLFLVLSKRILARVDPLTATAWLMAFGALAIACYGGPSLVRAWPPDFAPWMWGLAAAIVLVPTAGVYVLAYWALARVESSAVALFVYLQPLIAGTLSVVFFGEVLAARLIAGGLLIFAGVGLTLVGKRQPRQQLRPDR